MALSLPHLEEDISAELYERFRTCTAALSEPGLRAAYVASWSWARELLEVLTACHDLALPQGVLSQIDQRVSLRGDWDTYTSEDAPDSQGRVTGQDGRQEC